MKERTIVKKVIEVNIGESLWETATDADLNAWTEEIDDLIGEAVCEILSKLDEGTFDGKDIYIYHHDEV